MMKNRLCWLWLALFLSQVPILTILQGSGLTGPRFSAVFLCSTTLVLIACGGLSRPIFGAADVVLLLFLSAIACSIAINGPTATLKEYVLLMLACAAYVAGRRFPGSLPDGSFLAVTAAVVTIGGVATAVATIQQASARHGKPMVFDRFDAAPAEFLICAAFLLFALIARKTTKREWVGWGAGLAIAVVIFAAAEVRYAFLAIFATVAIASIGLGVLPKRAVVAMLGILMVSVIVGLCTRPVVSAVFLREVLAPADCLNFDSSMAIRKMLFAEAVHLLPQAGAFGFGLSGFMSHSCIANTEVHNSFLQAFVEFGWAGGLLFVALIGTAIANACTATKNAVALFGVLGLCFTLLMSLAHGRLTEDSQLFFFVGCVAGAMERQKKVSALI